MLSLDKGKPYYIVSFTDAYGPVAENYFFENERDAYEFVKQSGSQGRYDILKCTVMSTWNKTITTEVKAELNEQT